LAAATPRERPTTGVLGLGRFGGSLARSLRDLGWPVDARGREQARQPLSDWARRCVIICIAVRDDQIADAVAELASLNLDFRGKTVMHHSGATPLAALHPLRDQGAAIAKFHPLQAFARADGAPIPAGTPFAVEGEPPAAVHDWARVWSCPIRELRGDDWRRYHLAAVVAANFLPLFIRAGGELLEPLAKDRADALEWLRPLVERSVAAALDSQIDLPFSGPAVRGDRKTLAAQAALLRELLPDLAPLYRDASSAIGARSRQAGVERTPPESE